ncbi:MAG: hypothetical protein COB35_12840 [Gammaproteobacteria bacterium]|nr:MAG: hypothetical protein COB35_12840 [Gammaproteobacteria bacterium]
MYKYINVLIAGWLLSIASMANASLITAPVDHFLFEAGATDTGTNPLTMQNIGGVTFADLTPNGLDGLAAVFNGNALRAQAAGSRPNNVSGDFSVSFWMQTSTTSGSHDGPWYAGKGLVDSERGGVTSDWGISLINNKIAFGIGGRPRDTTIFSSTIVNDNLWHNIVAAWDISTGSMNLFVDGLQSATGVSRSRNQRWGSNNLTLGSISTFATQTASWSNNYKYDGLLADVRIYGQTLDINDAQKLSTLVSVPEPSTLAIFALGMIGLASCRFKKQF